MLGSAVRSAVRPGAVGLPVRRAEPHGGTLRFPGRGRRAIQPPEEYTQEPKHGR